MTKLELSFFTTPPLRSVYFYQKEMQPYRFCNCTFQTPRRRIALDNYSPSRDFLVPLADRANPILRLPIVMTPITAKSRKNTPEEHLQKQAP
uniref:PAZ domain-containing protein n=1 Tax=Steinernema glaseri TaxID=37863 RepID=A0A1I7Z6J6_9BILA